MATQLDLLAVLFPPVAEVTPESARAAWDATGDTTPEPVTRQAKHYYRCADCLTVAATVEKLADGRDTYGYPTGRPAAVCDACGGGIEYMGEVHRDTLHTSKGWAPICDGRCTHATGPSCDCKCGGKNHGSHLVVEVVTVSGLPRLGIQGPQARMAGEMWRGLIARYRLAWRARFGYVTDAKRSGRYLDPSEWVRYREGGRVAKRFAAIREGRTGARVRKLEALVGEISEVTA